MPGSRRALRDDGVEVAELRGQPAGRAVDRARPARATPYRVFTPVLAGGCSEQPVPRRRSPAPRASCDGARALAADDLDDWELLPTDPTGRAGLREAWTPGEAAAHARLEHFARRALADYHRRDEPAVEATSPAEPAPALRRDQPGAGLAPAARRAAPAARRNAAKFLSELGWREFNWNILFHVPDLATKNLRPEFDAFPWAEPDAAELAAWQQGRTGIPLVDAGMRELWHDRLHAQPGAHGRRELPDQEPARSTGGSASSGSGTPWSTPTRPATPATGSGWPGAGRMPRPTSACSTPSCRRASSTRDGEYLGRWVPELGTDRLPASRSSTSRSRGARRSRRTSTSRRALRSTGRPPITITARAATRTPASRRARRRRGRATHESRKPAENASPAPVGSTIRVGGAGTLHRLRAVARRRARRRHPRVMHDEAEALAERRGDRGRVVSPAEQARLVRGWGRAMSTPRRSPRGTRRRRSRR